MNRLPDSTHDDDVHMARVGQRATEAQQALTLLERAAVATPELRASFAAHTDLIRLFFLELTWPRCSVVKRPRVHETSINAPRPALADSAIRIEHGWDDSWSRICAAWMMPDIPGLATKLIDAARMGDLE